MTGNDNDQVSIEGANIEMDAMAAQPDSRTSSEIRADEMADQTERRHSGRSTLSPQIVIIGTDAYHDQVNDALQKIWEGPKGRKLIADFAKWPDKTIYIRNIPHAEDSATPFLTERQERRYNVQSVRNVLNPLAPSYSQRSNDVASNIARRKLLGFGPKGEGANTEIIWRPNDSLKLNAEGRPTGIKTDPSESYLGLAHELIHARGIAKGTFLGGKGDRHKAWTLNGREEQRATHGGLFKGVFNRKGISENAIRKEHDAQWRKTYNAVKGPKDKPGKALAKERTRERGLSI